MRTPRSRSLVACSMLALVAHGICLPTNGIAEEVHAFDTVRGWGLVIDPAGDCTFRHEGESFAITVPGAEHNLWPIKGKVNAPLVLQDVEGDFSIQVRIASVDIAERDTAIPGLASTTAFHAGTLVIWDDARNFVRFDRTDMNKAGRRITSAYFHVFRDGQRVVELSSLVPDNPTHLRLSRTGERINAAWSQDGERWTALPEQSLHLPAKVKAGVSALNSTTRDCTVQFDGLKISR